MPTGEKWKSSNIFIFLSTIRGQCDNTNTSKNNGTGTMIKAMGRSGPQPQISEK